MASLFRTTAGTWVAQWGPVTARKTIRLGNVSQKTAEKITAAVEQMADEIALTGKLSLDSERFVAETGPGLRRRLEQAGLVAAASSVTVVQLCREFEKRHKVADSTMAFYGHTIRNLIHLYGTRLAASLAPNDFRQYLRTNQYLSDATINRRVIAARTIFNFGMEIYGLRRNPFADVVAGSQRNDARRRYVLSTDFRSVVYRIPDDRETRCALALCRWAGLRFPSEHFAMRWADVDWANETILIRSKKLSGHDNETRLIPMFADVKPFLRALRDVTPLDAEYVFPTLRQKSGGAVRSRLEKILRQLGINQWPRLFHNLRASCETDLLAAGYSLTVVAIWLGHSSTIAVQHYATVTPMEMKRAAALRFALRAGDDRSGLEDGMDATDDTKNAGGTTYNRRTVGVEGLAGATPAKSKAIRAAKRAAFLRGQRLLARCYARVLRRTSTTEGRRA